MGDHQSVASSQPQPLRQTHSPRVTEQHRRTSPKCNKQLPTNKSPAMPLSSSWPEQLMPRVTFRDHEATVNFNSTAEAATPSAIPPESSEVEAASQYAKNSIIPPNSRTSQATTFPPSATESGGRVSAAAASSPQTGCKVTGADRADVCGLIVGGGMPEDPSGSHDDGGDMPHSFPPHQHASQIRHFSTHATDARAPSMPPPLLLLPEAPSGQMLSPPPQSVNSRELLRNRSSVGVVASGGARTPATPIAPAAIRTPRNAGPGDYGKLEALIVHPGLAQVLGHRFSKPAETGPPERPRTQDVPDVLQGLFPCSGSGAETFGLQSRDDKAAARAHQDEAVGGDRGGERGGGGDGGRRDGDGGTNEDETETDTETVTVMETDGETETAAACTAGVTGFSQWASAMEAANSSLLPTPFGGQMPSRLKSDALRSGIRATAPAAPPPPPARAPKQSTEGSTILRFTESAAGAAGLLQKLATTRPPSADWRASPTKHKRPTSYSQFTPAFCVTSGGLGPEEREVLPLEVIQPQTRSEPGGLEATLEHALPPTSFLPAALAMPPPRAQFKQQQRQLQQQQQQLAQSPPPQTTQQVNSQHDERMFFPDQWTSQPGQPQAQAPVHHVADGVGDKSPGDSARGANLPPPIHVTVAAAKRPRADSPGGASGTKRRPGHNLSFGPGLVNYDPAGAAPATCTTDISAAVTNPDMEKLAAQHGAGELTGVAGLKKGAPTPPPSSSSQSAAASTTALAPDFAFVRQRRTVNLAGFNVHLDPGMVCEVVGLFHPVQYMAGAPCIEYPPGSGLFISRSHFEKIGGSLTAKWYRSLRVIPSLESLGDWLQRQHLPVFKGCPRRSQKAAAAEVATANTAGTETAQRREAPRNAVARSAATTPEPSGRTRGKPTGTSSTTPPATSYEEATAVAVPATAPTTGPSRVVVGNENPDEAASSNPRVRPGAVSAHWPPSYGDSPYNVGPPRPPGTLPLALPPHCWPSAAAAPDRVSPLTGAVPALSSSALYDRARMRSSHLLTDPAHLDHQCSRGLVLYGARGLPAWPQRRLTTWQGDLNPDQQKPLRPQTANAAAAMEGGRRFGGPEEGEQGEGAAGIGVGMGGFGGDMIEGGADGNEGRRMATGSGQIPKEAAVYDMEGRGVEVEAGTKISAAEATGRTGFNLYGVRTPPFERHLYGMAPLTRTSLQEMYGSAISEGDGEPVSLQLMDNANVANKLVLRPYSTASLGVTDEPPAGRRDRTSGGGEPESVGGGGVTGRRMSILEAGQSESLAPTEDMPSGSTAHGFFSGNQSLYKQHVPYTYPSPYFLQPRRGAPSFWSTTDACATLRSAAGVGVNDERRYSDGSGGDADGQGAAFDVLATPPRRPVLPSFPPPPHPLMPPYYYGPRAIGRPGWRTQFPLVRRQVPPPGRPGYPGSSSTLAVPRPGSHLPPPHPAEDEYTCTRITGNPGAHHELDIAPDGDLGGFPPADTLPPRRQNWIPAPLPPPPTTTGTSTSSGISFPAPATAAFLKHLSERATFDGMALERDRYTTSSSALQSAATATVEVVDDDRHDPTRSSRSLHLPNALGARPPPPAAASLHRSPLLAPSSVPGRAAPDPTASEQQADGLPPTQLQRGRLSAQSLPTAPAAPQLQLQPHADSDSPPRRAPPPPHPYSRLPDSSGHQPWPPQLSGHPNALVPPPHHYSHNPQQHPQAAAWRMWPASRGASHVGAPQRSQLERQLLGQDAAEGLSAHELIGWPQGLPQPTSQRQLLVIGAATCTGTRFSGGVG